MSRTRALVLAGISIVVVLLAIPAVGPYALSPWSRPDPGPATDAQTEALSWSVSLDDASSNLWESFPVTITWSDPAARTGDGFSLTLPAELIPLSDGFDVRTATGETVARAAVDDQSLTVTYTEAALEHGTITGTGSFMAGWDDTLVGAGEDVTLVFAGPASSAEATVRIPADRVDAGEPRLYGYWRDRAHEDRVAAANALQWRFVTPVGPLSETSVEVELSDGHRLNCAEISGRLQTSFATNGDVIDAHDLPADSLNVLSCNSSGFTLDLPNVAAGTALMVQYSSTVTDAAAQSYTASARATIDERTHEFTSTIERTIGAGTGHGAMTHEPTAAPGPRTQPPASGALGWIPVTALTLLGAAGLLYRITRRAR
ncbi:Ig-like domain-containing protein [Ruania halotolerans]|uniref:Ig-like domain-containing protein n=1 Tax=Ruania halotolerans TaxID=2897773 RepID=UPI001E655FD7|nr:Ig-like domain-containing protein [Ruania halotolerans]UFU06788.1 Ig-like domain-containing protein [Ruania halotolerans]